MHKKLSEIAALIGGELEGEDILVGGISGSADASSDFLTFMEHDKYRSTVEASEAAGVIIPLKSSGFDKPVIRVKNPRLAFAQVLSLFNPRKKRPLGIHPSAVIGEGAKIGENVSIGAYVVVDSGAEIGNGAEIFPFCFIGEGASVGEDSVLEPRVSIMAGCRIGRRCLIHSGAVIGADGFGFVRDGAFQVKIPQIGIVSVEDDVEIGANATIDRATTGKTVIGCGTKIDNLVQIGHNTCVGRDCTIVSLSGVAGSTKIGDRVIIAAQAGVRDHTEIGSDCIVGGRAGVTKPIKPGSVVSGCPARDHREELRIEAAVSKLPEFMMKAEKLLKKIDLSSEK